MKTGRKPKQNRSVEDRDHAEKERQRYQNLSPVKRKEKVDNRDRDAQVAADARRYERDKPKRQAKDREQQAKNWERDAPKRKARAKAALTPVGKCSRCGSSKNVERHHPDHRQPSKFVAVCARCHGEETQKERSRD